DGQPRAILAWVSNTERSSYFSLAVEGHTFYRLNYPLRLNRWYHTCQSWNGRTGEWQIWVNAERVGRGFHNRLVGHHIPSGGIAITGQEQTQYGGGFLEGVEAPKGAGGMLGEVTMIQLYSVALTAGKAHRNHKHHHAHRYDHNGMPITTTPRPPRPPRPMTPTHPLLTGGQLNPNVALTIASGQTQQLLPQIPQIPQIPQLIPGQSFSAQLLNGQFVNNLVQQQLMNTPQSRGPQQFLPQDPQQLPQPQPLSLAQQPLQILPQPGQIQQLPQNPSPLINSGLVHPSLINPANVQFIDTQIETHQLFKRDNKNSTKDEETSKSDKKKVAPSKDTKETKEVKETKEKVKTELKPTNKSSIDPVEAASTEENPDKKQTKRELILHGGSIIDDTGFANAFEHNLLSGLAGIGQNEPVLQLQKQYEEREPAEAEVAAVMNLCSGCDEEPFGKALVFGWRAVPKKLYSGAFYTPAVPRCKAF
ncbi:hypothetical protein ILUMI_00293, partial [Ignelater luminosus]